jgi:hypothetical protein
MIRAINLLFIGSGCAVIWIFGYRLYGWLLTGSLYITPKSSPGHYVTYSQDHVGFLIAFVLYVVAVGTGIGVISVTVVKSS